MEIVKVILEPDFLDTFSHTKPLAAITELIWNALDADSKNVRVEFDYNNIGGIEEIRIIDDGLGMTLDEAKAGFGKLGGSWKKDANRTRGGRFLHGKEGKGRFRSFALGNSIAWHTVSKNNGTLKDFTINSSHINPGEYNFTAPVDSENKSTGTIVRVKDPEKSLGTLDSESAISYITSHFALYLRQYPDVRITYNSNSIDPSAVEEKCKEIDFEIQVDVDEVKNFKLTIIEWKKGTSKNRALMLCDEEGFTLHETKPGIRAPGFIFTAYLSSEYIKTMEENGIIDVEELSGDMQLILKRTKRELRNYFRERESEQARFIIDEWKTEDVYPYSGEPSDILETAERQVFDVVALNIHEYLPEFEESEQKNKKLALRLVRHALETNPSAILRIFQDVVNLPIEKQEEFVELLDKTSLESIVTASKLITDRLEFLRGFNSFLFEPESKKVVLERQQLQQLLVNEPWIFGEQYNLSQQEATLTDVLRRHYDLIEKNKAVGEKVTRLDGTEGRVDLMFGAVTQFHPGKREHLIVELKRPSRKIDPEAVQQVMKYAEAVASDDRFDRTDTTWEFHAISNDLHESVKPMANQTGRPRGLYLDHPDQPIKIWVKTWGEVIQECEARLLFVKNCLNYDPSRKSGLEYLRKKHSEYLPSLFDDIKPEDESTQ